MEFWDGSGISWTICKQSAPRSPHNHTNKSSLNFYRPDALPVAQPIVSKHRRHNSDSSGNIKPVTVQQKMEQHRCWPRNRRTASHLVYFHLVVLVCYEHGQAGQWLLEVLGNDLAALSRHHCLVLLVGVLAHNTTANCHMVNRQSQ